MITAIHGLIKKHPVIFGVLVFITAVISAALTIVASGSLYYELKCVPDPSDWFGMNIMFFLIQTSPLAIIWAGLTTYCAMKCKPSNTAAWVATTLLLYGYSFYSHLGNLCR